MYGDINKFLEVYGDDKLAFLESYRVQIISYLIYCNLVLLNFTTVSRTIEQGGFC